MYITDYIKCLHLNRKSYIQVHDPVYFPPDNKLLRNSATQSLEEIIPENPLKLGINTMGSNVPHFLSAQENADDKSTPKKQ